MTRGRGAADANADCDDALVELDERRRVRQPRERRQRHMQRHVRKRELRQGVVHRPKPVETSDPDTSVFI